MSATIRTRSFEVPEAEYIKALVFLQRKRMWIFDVIAAVLTTVVGHYLVGLAWPISIVLAPCVFVLGYLRLPMRVKRQISMSRVSRPHGAITFHIDAEGIIYFSLSNEPAVVKWEEIRRVVRYEKNYWIDAGFDDYLITSDAFETASDELAFQQRLAEKNVKRLGF